MTLHKIYLHKASQNNVKSILYKLNKQLNYQILLISKICHLNKVEFILKIIVKKATNI